MGIEAAGTNERTVAGWNILLRANRERFPHPNPKIHKQKKPLPDLLAYFQEEIAIPWHQYCIENLADLTIELARNELITKILPSAIEEASNGIVMSNERGGQGEDKQSNKHNERDNEEVTGNDDNTNNRLQ
jgi:hypothetical protein